jgi:hypothetical protein
MTGQHQPEAALPVLLWTPLYIQGIYIQEGSKLQSSTLGHLFPVATSSRKLQSSATEVYYTPSKTHKKCNWTDYHHKSVQKEFKTHAHGSFSQTFSQRNPVAVIPGGTWNSSYRALSGIEEAQPSICGWNRRGTVWWAPPPPPLVFGTRRRMVCQTYHLTERIKLLRLAFLPTGYLMGGVGAPCSVPATY